MSGTIWIAIEDRLYLNDGKGDFVRSVDALPKLGRTVHVLLLPILIPMATQIFSLERDLS